MTSTHTKSRTTKPRPQQKSDRTTVDFSDQIGALLDRIKDADQMPSRASTLRALVVREARRRGWDTPPAVISMSHTIEGSDAKQSDN